MAKLHEISRDYQLVAQPNKWQEYDVLHYHPEIVFHQDRSNCCTPASYDKPTIVDRVAFWGHEVHLPDSDYVTVSPVIPTTSQALEDAAVAILDIDTNGLRIPRALICAIKTDESDRNRRLVRLGYVVVPSASDNESVPWVMIRRRNGLDVPMQRFRTFDDTNPVQTVEGWPLESHTTIERTDAGVLVFSRGAPTGR